MLMAYPLIKLLGRQVTESMRLLSYRERASAPELHLNRYPPEFDRISPNALPPVGARLYRRLVGGRTDARRRRQWTALSLLSARRRQGLPTSWRRTILLGATQSENRPRPPAGPTEIYLRPSAGCRYSNIERVA